MPGKNYLQTHGTAMGSKMLLLLPTSSRQKKKQIPLAEATQNRSFGKDS